MVLGKLPAQGHPTNLDSSRARAHCTCSRCGWGTSFFSRLSFLFPFYLSLGDGPIKTEKLSQRAVKPETTNQLLRSFDNFFSRVIQQFISSFFTYSYSKMLPC